MPPGATTLETFADFRDWKASHPDEAENYLRQFDEAAARLNLAEGTVKNHVTSILTKLDVRDRTQAAIRARQLGIA